MDNSLRKLYFFIVCKPYTLPFLISAGIMEALMRGDIVSPETFDLMRESHTKKLFNSSDYGYGLLIGRESDSFGHTGGFDGLLHGCGSILSLK